MTEGKYRDPHESELAARRPKHPDFWRLSKVVREHDDRAIDEGLPALTAELADLDSVSYMADQRVLRVEMLVTGTLPPAMRDAMQSLYLDAFYAGVGFQRAGGHQEGE